MVWIKYVKGNEVFLGYKRGSLVRLGTRKWAADFELTRDMLMNEIVKAYRKIVDEELDVEDAARLLGARVIDVRRDDPMFDTGEFTEVHYRWDAIKYIRPGRLPIYQRRGEKRAYDSDSGRVI